MKTSTFTVNNVGDPEQVAATIACREISIAEDPSVTGYPINDYKVYGTAKGSTAIRVPIGSSFVFKREYGQASYLSGEIVGYVETVQGATTFQKVER